MLIRCQRVVCRLGGQIVLDRLDLELSQGESLALVGASGSGKSSLLRIIAGLEIPERGEVFVADELATGDGRLVTAPYRRQLAMLFQDLALWPNLTVTGNVRLGLAALHLPRRVGDRRVEEALEICGIHDLADRRPGTLSGGEQQRVALARALAMRPRLLLLDEPFGGLDLVTRRQIIGEVARLRSKLGFALIVVTHDPAEVRLLCDSLAVLEGGRLVDHGTLAEVVARPRSELARAFGEQLARDAPAVVKASRNSQ